MYIETQGAYALPLENDTIKIYSSTQGHTAVQRTVAKILGVPMHKIEVDVTRLGGGFGGKERPSYYLGSNGSTRLQKIKTSCKMHTR